MEGKLVFFPVIRQEVNNILYFWASINKIRYYDNDTGQRVACQERHHEEQIVEQLACFQTGFPF